MGMPYTRSLPLPEFYKLNLSLIFPDGRQKHLKKWYINITDQILKQLLNIDLSVCKVYIWFLLPDVPVTGRYPNPS